MQEKIKYWYYGLFSSYEAIYKVNWKIQQVEVFDKALRKFTPSRWYATHKLASFMQDVEDTMLVPLICKENEI